MRTVSFSSPPVRKKLERNFVAFLVNTEGDPSAGASQGHAPTDAAGMCSPGIGNQNVQTLFLTPEGQIFHTASGFRDADSLLSEMTFAEALFREIQSQPQEAEQLIQTRHRQRMQKDGFSDAQLKRSGSPMAEMLELARQNGHSLQSILNGNNGNPLNTRGDMKRLNDGIFSGKTKQSKLLDYRFAAHHPLMTFEELQKSPRLLVGNASTTFVSGPASGGQIGGTGSRP